MIYEKNLQFADGQVLAAAAASTDHIDLGSDRDIGPGTPLWLVVVVRTAITGTLQVQLQSDDNAGFATPTTLLAGETLAAPAAGTKIVLPMPHTNERYLRAYFGGAPTAGVVDAFLTSQEPPNWQALPDAI